MIGIVIVVTSGPCLTVMNRYSPGVLGTGTVIFRLGPTWSRTTVFGPPLSTQTSRSPRVNVISTVPPAAAVDGPWILLLLCMITERF